MWHLLRDITRSADEKRPQFSKVGYFDMIAIRVGILIYLY